MRKVERTVIKRVILCTLFALLGWSLCAQSSALLLEHKIRQASFSELQAMMALRNLEQGSEQEMREKLLVFHALERQLQTVEGNEEDTYRLTIHSSDRLQTDSGSSLVLLEGNVVISFSLEGETAQKRLSSDAMLIDLEQSLLSARGSVRYEDGDADAALSTIEGSIVSFNWVTQNLIISDATTSNTKSNSDDVAIDLYTHGSLITYRGKEGGIFYDDGFLATRDQNPLSSIHAKRLSFISGGDLMVNNATLKLGRVPVFWTPFFFFPSNRMVGNPSIGFVSDRGMFVSTTWELWGRYPNFAKAEQNSFTLLLSGAQDEQLYPSDVLYTKERTTTPFTDWVDQSGSYFTLFADAYEMRGLYLGYEMKSASLSKNIVFESASSFALDPLGKEPLTTYGSVPSLRYWGRQALTFNTSLMNIKLQIPYYSDPSVLTLYGNRLSSFSFDALLGKEQDFPNTFRSDITSYTWSLNSSIRFPTQSTRPYLSELSISKLDAQANWVWKAENGLYGYQLQKVTIPSLQMRLGGTLVSLQSQSSTSSSKQQSSRTDQSENVDLLVPPLMSLPQQETVKSTSVVSRNLSLSYSFNQQLEHTINVSDGIIDFQNDRYIYALSKGSVVLKAVPDSRFFTFSQELLPQFSFIEDQSKLTYQTQQVQLFSVTKAQIPTLGLSYHLSNRLYRSETQLRINLDPLSIVDPFQFDKASVTIHQLKFEKALSLGLGTLTPSISTNLYPLAQSMLWQLRYSKRPWSAMLQYRFTEKNDELKPDIFTSEIAYTSNAFGFSLQQRYDAKRTVSHYADALSFSATARQTLFGSSVVLNQRLQYQVLTTANQRHYFDRVSFEAKIPYVQFSYNLKGPYDQLKPTSFSAKFSAKELETRLWRRRIALSLGLDSTLNYSFEDRYSSYFDIQAKIGLRIAEFADFYVSLASSNTGFFRYYDASDQFSFNLLWQDLIRSFDFFGDGRYNTQFNLSSLTVELVHYLTDWSLNCKYTGSVVLSNNQYSWVPTFSVYLKWITIPELDVEETWKRSDTTWMRTSGT